jgi:hypothetical protein
MVHALREIWRVLAPDSLLLDLRPLSGAWPVEVVSAGGVMVTGHVDESDAARVADDRAADAALAAVAQAGLFARERDGAFDFSWYWDSLGEAQAHIAEKWPEARVPEEVLAETQRQMARAGDGARVRATARVVISRWRRLGP